MNTAVVASVLLARHTTRSCRPRPAFLVPSFGSQKAKSTPARWGFSTNAADPYGIVRSASLDATGPDAWKSLSSRDCQRLLETASQAARAAGAVITAHLGCAAELEAGTTHHSSRAIDVKTNIKDIVTEYDKQAQLAVETIVRAAYPTHSFLGEEDVDPGAAASEAALSTTVQNSESGYVWICDPIDGTANFASGLRLCAVTMAVVYQGITVVGVVYDPHEDELFAAVRGQGATVNGQPLRVADTVTNVHDAIVNAGCPADPAAFATSMRGVLALNGTCRGIRVVACSALTLSWIAAGRLAAHFGYDLSSWDLAAGALLVQEAGGVVTDLDGSEYQLSTRNMLCSNGHVHEDILQVLREADAVSFRRSL